MTFDKFCKLMTTPKAILIYWGFVSLSFLYLDKPLSEYFLHLNLKANAHWIDWVGELGQNILYLPSFFLLTIIFKHFYKNKLYYSQSLFLFLCTSITGLFSLLIKITIARARPLLWFNEQLYGFHWFSIKATYMSFPSGHTCTIMSVMFGLSCLYPRYFLFFLITGLCIASSRVLLTAHYLSDIAGGVYLALLVVAWLKNRFFDQKALNHKSKNGIMAELS
jgi:membrane-associated phospholipid phosphatase